MDSASLTRVRALLRLLSDPNEQVAQTIQDELASMGSAILPFLESAQAEDPLLSPRLACVIEEICFPQLVEEFRYMICSGSPEWESGAFLIAKLRYPALSVSRYQQQLDELAVEYQERWKRTSLTVEDRARRLSTFLFSEKGFSGNHADYYDPDNSFLPCVLDRRQGIPITLSALYVFVGTRVGLSAAGVGMPGHFLVRVTGAESPLFVDAFNGGQVLRERDCRQCIETVGLVFHTQYLEQSRPTVILSRMLRNVLNIYEADRQWSMIQRVKALLACIDSA